MGALLPVALLLLACSPDAKEPVPATSPAKTDVAIPVAVVAAVPASGNSALAISGTVRLKRETPLGFNTSGRIAAILVREGDTVGQGAVLARLDPTSLAAASTSARAEAARAEADYRRLSSLFAKGWVTAPRVETARATAAAAQARVAQSGFDVGLATIRAPSAGVVLRRPAEPGQMATPGQTVLIVGELASGYVLQLPVSDADLGRIAIGQQAAVTIPALGVAPIAARVSEIGARGDDATGTFRVELALPARLGLRSGLIGSALLRFGGVGTGGAVSVPASAVFSARADEGFVYVLDAAGTHVKRRLVTIGQLGDTALTITAGLNAGERVVTSGADRLRDGMRVTVARG
ncbi:MAG: efflux RND transporter periplasmic adaptor subunit [Polymorphobacter sp.]